MNDSRYPVPAGPHRVVEEIKRSRFITTVANAPTVVEAQLIIQQHRDEFPDATHHCWAYVVGPPASTAQVGMSDDGEPHGTAGRPMLNVLLHADVGDVVAVVTRYYGGTNLGTGGLVRAYSGGVTLALAGLPRREKVDWVEARVRIDYSRLSALEMLFPDFEVHVDARRFEAEVTLDLRLPRGARDRFASAVYDLTRGQVTLS